MHVCARFDAGIVLDFGILYNTGWTYMHAVSNGCLCNHASGFDSTSVANAGFAA